ncbi:MAG: UvrD-helicase domain-containing protein [Methylophilaceae bacterium]
MLHEDLLQEDSLSRERALAPDSFIVEAPAGAGKTELLTQRFLKLLETVDSPEEIIAITFTNKAASEMKSRIMDSLQMAATGKMSELSDLPHKQTTFKLGLTVLARSETLGWRLLDTPSRLRIYTIDSLSANLARQMPLLSRFGTQPGVRDDPRVHYEEAATRAIELLEHKDYGNAVHDALRYFDNDTYKLTQLLAEMLAKRDQWLSYTQSQNTAEAAEAALATMISADIQTAATALPDRLQQALMPVARFAAGNLDSEAAIALLLDWQTPIKAHPSALQHWRALADLLLTNSGTLRKALNKNIGLPATSDAKQYKESLLAIIATLQQTSGAEEAIARLRMLPKPQQDENTWQIIATLAQLLHIAVGELWLVFQAHGEVDFVEISNRSLLALEDISGNTTDLAMKLDYRIQHLLVDEFQDTSPSQIKLIQALTNGWQTDDGRTLFCVGDPMQSIYRFRKANVGLFLRVVEHGIGNIRLKSLKLWRNNRSTPAVVEWVNEAFAKVFPAQDSMVRGAIQYRPFVATKASETGAGVVVHAMLDNKATANVDDEGEEESLLPSDIRQLEADRIIEIIHETRASNPEAKIAVLVRARNHLKALVTEIRRNHPALSFQAVEIEELANRQIVQDLLSLSYALHQRADRVHWLAILRAPWCGMTLADLHALIANDKTSTLMQLMHDEARLQQLSDDGRTRLHHVREVLSQALQHQGRMSVSRWLHGVWLMLGGADCLWDAGDVRDVQAFFERIQQLEVIGQFSPQHLADEVEKLYAAPDAKADDTLQFMTIHKSKGLEFDTVILPGLDRKTGGNDQPLLLWEEVSSDEMSHQTDDINLTVSKLAVSNLITSNLIVAPYIPKELQDNDVTPYDYLKLLEKERGAYEDARVLYVAATRAERCLHLLGAASIDVKGTTKAPKNTFLDMLWPIVQAQFTEAYAIKPNQLTQTSADTALEGFIPQLIRLDKPAIPPVLTTAPKEAVKSLDSGDKTEDCNTLDADVGFLTHFYLQLVADSGIKNWSASRVNTLSPAMQRWFKQRSYDTKKSELGAARVNTLLQTTLDSEQGRWVLQDRDSAASELAIEYATQQAVTKRIIDRTFIVDGMRWIIDYKSLALASDTTDAELKTAAGQYKEQLDGYEKLFKDEGLPTQKAIFFVSLGKMVEI